MCAISAKMGKLTYKHMDCSHALYIKCFDLLFKADSWKLMLYRTVYIITYLLVQNCHSNLSYNDTQYNSTLPKMVRHKLWRFWNNRMQQF